MNKINVIQKIIDKKKARTYLEIGVSQGVSFMPIKARHKIAVDPKFAITRKSRIKWLLMNFDNVMADFNECTSDDFFARNPSHRADVVFIDGLHTFEQSLRDVVNSLSNLNESGVILIHDCLPPHRAAANPTQLSQQQAADLNIAGWTPEWCGDVWKTICYLRSQRSDLKVFVLDFDMGIGIVTRGIPDSRLNLSEDELNKMTYEDLVRDKKNLLNLKDENYLLEFLKSI